MPNWCSNALFVWGDQTVQKFHDMINVELGFYASFIPEPPDHPGHDWMSWRRKHWGTKWDSDSSQLDRSIDRLKFTAEWYSPWGPPIEAITTMSEMFPKLWFELWYEEPGMAFEGQMLLRAGETEDARSEGLPDTEATMYERFSRLKEW